MTMHDIMFCLLVAAARYTFITTPCRERADGALAFLYHPTMEDNSDIYYMYQMG